MTYYTVDTTAISYSRYWRWKPTRAFIVLALKKLLKIRIASNVRFARPDNLVIRNRDQVDPIVLKGLEPNLLAAETNGFRLRFFYYIPSEGPFSADAAAALSADNRTVAVLGYARHTRGKSEVSSILYSRHSNGNYVSTTNHVGLIEPPPFVNPTLVQGGSFQELADAHSTSIASDKAKFSPILEDAVESFLLELLLRCFDYQIERRIYVPV